MSTKQEFFDMSFWANRPYNELPHCRPPAMFETRRMLKACIGARAALAELKVGGSLIPNQAMLINSIPTLEAQALLDKTAATIRARAPKIYSRELAEIIFVQPYCRIGNLVDADIAQRQSASVYLKTLCEIGVLEERKSGRDKLFINRPLLKLLTEREG